MYKCLVAVLGGSLILNKYRYVTFWFKSILGLIAVAITSVSGMVIALLIYYTPLRGNALYYVSGLFYNMLSPILGIKVKVTYPDSYTVKNLPIPAVYIANHQASLDVLVMSALWIKKLTVIAKSSMRYYPLLGQFMALSDAIFLKRREPQKAIESLNIASEEIIGNNIGVFLYPEGTRSDFSEPNLLPFKKGAFHMAIKAGVPVVPVVISHYSHLYNFKSRIIKPGTIHVKCKTL
jgi:lysophosphatidate acyltransferase